MSTTDHTREALAEILREHGIIATSRSQAVFALDAHVAAVVEGERAEIERAREERDIRANQVEEAQSILEMVKDRVDDFTYDEFSSVLDDGPTDDEHGDVIPSPLRRERDEARTAVAQVTCTICEEVIVPSDDASADGDRWAHRDCSEAGE